ncbi:MAG TPA: serine/threonine-protein kinase, partial [Polyangiaceae bacterium]|nr:serine/threonine-protein kinase [Polyangiaceae bacterium]
MSQSNRRPEETGQIKPLEAFDLSLAASLGKYRLLGALGHGGMADVYLAIADGPEGFRKLCVLKMLKESMEADEDFRAMFLDEARLAARMNHPNVVQTFEVDDTQGRLMLAMEYVEGQPITRVRRRVAPEQFPLTAYVRVLCDVLEGLDYAHNLADYDGSILGIVHRDVTPHNILVGYDGRVKLVDFGIAKSAAASQMTQAGVLKGKVGYMSPEQASLGVVDGRADVFSVGVILWEAIAGRRFAEGASARDVLTRRIDGTDPKIAEIVPEVDPELAAICDRAMATKPANRFATPSEFQLAMEAWLRKHGEPPRKVWAKALRDAFAPEREQLRALIEQRVTDNGMSGIRSSLFTTGSHTAASSGPHSVPRIST